MPTLGAKAKEYDREKKTAESWEAYRLKAFRTMG